MNKNKTQNKDHKYDKLAIWLMLLAVCLFAIGVILSILLKSCDQVFRENVITVYAASSGGFITLFGVSLTIIANKEGEKERRRIGHIPEFFICDKFDLSKVINYSVGQNSSEILIPNNHIYIKNTDKTEFIIKEVIIWNNGKVAFSDSNSFYIDKGLLFCLSFYYDNKVDKIAIKTNSVDEYEYVYEIDLMGHTIERKAQDADK